MIHITTEQAWLFGLMILTFGYALSYFIGRWDRKRYERHPSPDDPLIQYGCSIGLFAGYYAATGEEESLIHIQDKYLRRLKEEYKDVSDS